MNSLYKWSDVLASTESQDALWNILKSCGKTWCVVIHLLHQIVGFSNTAEGVFHMFMILCIGGYLNTLDATLILHTEEGVLKVQAFNGKA